MKYNRPEIKWACYTSLTSHTANHVVLPITPAGNYLNSQNQYISTSFSCDVNSKYNFTQNALDVMVSL